MKHLGLSTLLAGVLAMSLTGTGNAQTPRGPLPLDELQVLASSWSVLKDSLAVAPDPKALLIEAIKGMARGADSESGEYFTAEEFAEFKAGRRTDYGAVGAEVRRKDTRFVLSPAENGPAVEAGVMFGDELHAVDGVHTKDMDLSDVVRKLGGPLGSKVKLTIFRESALKVMEVTVERKAFSLPVPTVSRPAPGVVLLRVPAFRDNTLAEAVAALRKAWQQEPFKAVVLDLRGCPGGLLDTSVGVAAMFLPENEVVVQSRGAGKDANNTYRASKEFYHRRGPADPLQELPAAVRNLPLAVLVDASTASGGEIVAAALQDHKRAKIVGRKTYGRASIQTVTPLQMGAIKYTSSYWTSPQGRTIHRVGVSPDVLVDDPWASTSVEVAANAALGR